MRFVATTRHITLGPGTYLRIVPEFAVGRPTYGKRRDEDRVSVFTAEPPPDMPAGSVMVLNGQDCPVLWADGIWAIVEVTGRTWRMSKMTPADMSTYRNAYDRGSLVQEWIVQGPVDLAPGGTA